eukprot:gb/GEZN01021641.1/.p1 GENE.gb/GEZN01021641.1/~~gb/GEZN01021641.1/.p1  ORF type:complete len:188 (-),score=25.60 gb/GEZN01021641.1/:32-595(-)
MEAALRALREGKDALLVDFVRDCHDELNFSLQKIGDRGAEAVAKGLQINNSITELNLINNDIGDEGAKAIGTALQVNRTLTSLNLGRNYIRDDGAMAVAEALRVTYSLTKVDLSHNKITSFPLGELFIPPSVFPARFHKVTINLEGNSIRNPPQEEIKTAALLLAGDSTRSLSISKETALGTPRRKK